MAFKPALSYCAALVRSQDYDRYLCTLFAPASVQEPWFALFAFNQEIAAIPDCVSEPIMGFMRYAWWREALDEVFGQVPVRRHPVVQALAETVKRYNLPRAPFDLLIESREAVFAGNMPETAAQWEPYFRATSCGLLAQCARVVQMEPDEALDALGLAWGFTGRTRALLWQNERQEALNMLEAATVWLKDCKRLPRSFQPFKHSADFYIKRIRNGKPIGREASFPLLVRVGWGQFLDKFR